MSAATADVHIRSATVDDFGAVLAPWERSRSVAAVTPDDRQVLTRLLERSPDGLRVAELEGRLVGALIAVWGWLARR